MLQTFDISYFNLFFLKSFHTNVAEQFNNSKTFYSWLHFFLFEILFTVWNILLYSNKIVNIINILLYKIIFKEPLNDAILCRKLLLIFSDILKWIFTKVSKIYVYFIFSNFVFILGIINSFFNFKIKIV